MGLGSVRTAGEIAIRITKHLGFEPELCQRQISPRSNCDLCAVVCPVDAIVIERSSTPGRMADMSLDEDACIECGLCTQVCPTSAFSWANPSILQLRSKVAKLAQSNIGEIYLTCDKTGIADASASVVSVPCLGMLPWEFWLSIQSDYDNVSVFLPDGLCETCEVFGGEDLLVEEISQAEEVSGKGFNLIGHKSELAFRNVQAEQGYDPSRRGFFSGLVDSSKRVAGMAMESAIGGGIEEKPRNAYERFRDQRIKMKEVAGEEIDEVDEGRKGVAVGATAVLTGRRQLLLETLKRHPHYAVSAPLIIPSVNRLCTDCKACAYLCPTEAITIGPNGIMMNAQFCVGCDLCTEICYPKAITLVTKNALIFATDGPYDMKEEGVAGSYTITGENPDIHTYQGSSKARYTIHDQFITENPAAPSCDSRNEEPDAGQEQGAPADQAGASENDEAPSHEEA